MASSHDIVSNPFTVTLIRFKARQLCRRSDFSSSDFDDLSQSMKLYLIEKAHLFDPARGNLEAFVTNALKTWVAMELRYRGRQKRSDSFRAASLEGTAVESGGEVTHLGAVLFEEDGRRLTQTSPLSPTDRFEMRETIAHVMGQLAPEDRALLLSVTERGITATAESLGVSWRQVSNALARMRPLFEKAGLGRG